LELIKYKTLFVLFFQDIDIEQKINDAPDSSYEIGVFIGSILPYVILVAIAYGIYLYMKKRKE